MGGGVNVKALQLIARYKDNKPPTIHHLENYGAITSFLINIYEGIFTIKEAECKLNIAVSD